MPKNVCILLSESKTKQAMRGYAKLEWVVLQTGLLLQLF